MIWKKTRDSKNKKAEESKFDFKLKLIVFRKRIPDISIERTQSKFD